MADLEYKPVSHDHDAFLEKALKRRGFKGAYDALEDEYLLVRELLNARSRAGLTQEDVAASMGTTKSAVLPARSGVALPVGEHAEEVCTAVGCDVEIRLVPASPPRPTKASSGRRKG